MSSDEKVLDFPRVEVTSEENARRVMIEATRLARLAPGEWRLWIDRSAERLRIPRAILEEVIWWWLARAGMSVCDLPLSRSI